MYVLYICMYGIYMHVYVYNTYVLYICMWFSSMCVCVCVCVWVSSMCVCVGGLVQCMYNIVLMYVG